MKTYRTISIKRYTACLLVLLLLISCEDFIAVQEPDSQLGSSTLFKDAATADAAMVHIYSTLQNRALVTGEPSGLSILMGCYADELESYSNYGLAEEAFYQNSVQPAHEGVANLWNETYALVYASNAILEGLQGATAIPQADRERLTGEALFTRAYFHFYLLQLFGAIPYVTVTDYRVNATIPKISIEEAYTLIIADLQQAHALLPEEYYGASRSRPNRYAAAALLSRCYLYTGAWAAASDNASEVLNANGIYSLAATPEQVFLKDSPSTIWQLLPRSEGMPTPEGLNFYFEGAPYTHAVSHGLVECFEPGDLRRTQWLGEVTDGTTFWYYPNKYKQHDFLAVSSEYSIQLRLEEQLLIRAEARTMDGDLIGAMEDLNAVRNRAGLNNTAATTGGELLSAIVQERRVELFTELGHRFLDLVRTGNADTALGGKPGWDTTDRLLPLPQREISLNPNLLPQNAGY